MLHRGKKKIQNEEELQETSTENNGNNETLRSGQKKIQNEEELQETSIENNGNNETLHSGKKKIQNEEELQETPTKNVKKKETLRSGQKKIETTSKKTNHQSGGNESEKVESEEKLHESSTKNEPQKKTLHSGKKKRKVIVPNTKISITNKEIENDDVEDSEPNQKKFKKRKRKESSLSDEDSPLKLVYLVTEISGEIVDKIKIRKSQLQKRISEVLVLPKKEKLENVEKISKFEIQPNEEENEEEREDENIQRFEDLNEIKLFQQLSTREVDSILNSKQMKEYKKNLNDVATCIQERIEAFENILSTLNLTKIDYQILNLQKKCYPDFVISAEDLESLNSNELEKLENTLGSNKSQIEFQSCLILHLKINQMKIKGKSKDEIQNVKIKSALLLGQSQNVLNKSLLRQGSKMIQIGFLIAFVSALKRDSNEIKKNLGQ
jgi:hypothetical protein